MLSVRERAGYKLGLEAVISTHPPFDETRQNQVGIEQETPSLTVFGLQH